MPQVLAARLGLASLKYFSTLAAKFRGRAEKFEAKLERTSNELAGLTAFPLNFLKKNRSQHGDDSRQRRDRLQYQARECYASARHKYLAVTIEGL